MTAVPSDTAPLVELTEVRKVLSGFQLGPASLTVEPGYVTALVGANGSGKSTLFGMLMGLIHPDSGALSLFGRDYASDEVLIKRGIGYVPDVSIGHDEMTPSAFASFVGHWYPTWEQARYDDLLRTFDIDSRKPLRKLSKGTRRRVTLAAALATQARLLILDEPTDSLDPFARRVLLEAISDYVQDGQRSVLFATHIAGEVASVADYVAVLHYGQFLGTHEKDTLARSWQAIWVDREPTALPEGLPGLVHVAGTGVPVRLVSRSPKETRAVLEQHGIGIVRTTALDLDEILAHLVNGARPATDEYSQGQVTDQDAAAWQRGA